MDAKNIRCVGKPEALDTHRIAKPFCSCRWTICAVHACMAGSSRAWGSGHGAGMSRAWTRSVNALNAMVRGNDLGNDAPRSSQTPRSRKLPSQESGSFQS